MDRRTFVQVILAAAAAMGGRSVYGQTPKPPVLFGAPPSSKTIAVAVKRFDGASGVATFNGAIPLQIGQLQPADVGNVSAFDGDTELPIYVNALNGTHSDSSIKSLQVQVKISAANEVEIPLTLNLDVPPSAATFAPDTIDYRWCENPRFFFCTDAEHMCASHIAPLPLVPMNSPTLPTSWQTFLTTTADNWLGQVNNGGTASYNWGYGWCCRYIMTGDVQPLRDALKEIVDQTPNKYSPGLANYTLSATQTNYTQTEDPDNDAYFNPDNYPLTGGGLTPEWFDSSADFFMMYYLTGWEQARRNLVLQGAWQSNNVDAAVTNSIRREYRWEFMIPMLSYIMQNDVGVRSLGGGWNYNVMNNTVPFLKINETETATNLINPSVFNSGVWGATSTSDHLFEGGLELGQQPLFQYEMMFPALMMYYLNVEKDARIPGELSGIADYIWSQWGGPWADGVGTWYGQPRYIESDFTTLTFSSSDNKSFPYMLFPVLAYSYAQTGNTTHRDAVDLMVSQDISARGAMGGERKLGKMTGQMYAYAYHAAAYRAGVSSTGWDIV